MTTDSGKVAGKGENLVIFYGCESWYSHYANQCKLSLKDSKFNYRQILYAVSFLTVLMVFT